MNLVTPARGRASLAALLLLAGSASACSDFTPPSPPPAASIPPFPEPLDEPVKAEAPEPRPFERLRDQILDQWLRDDPSLGRGLGLHEWDGKVGDYSAEGIKTRLERVKKQRADLLAIDPKSLSADEALDRALMLNQADLTLFRGDDLAEWQHRPQFYEELFSVNSYLDRDYAPVEERVAHLLAHEEAALSAAHHILHNLKSPMSKPVVETAIKIFKGYAEYLRGDLVKQVKGVGDPGFQARLAKVNEALASVAQGLSDHLAKVELKKGDDSHVLGPELYKKLLHAQEGFDLPLAEFKRLGEENLAANKKAFEALAKKVHLTKVGKDDLFPDAAKLTAASRQFIIDKKLATIPTEEKAVVKESPPFMRWNSAFLDPPGPYEQKPMPAFYYITLPDPTWSKKEQLEYLMPKGVLLSTTVHEVYPGHFLQGQWIKRAPTRAQKMLAAYSFVEGWAHYGEQLMIEEGFGKEDPQSQLGQLSDALLRNCRVVVSLGIHAEKMTLAQAEKRFMKDCKQDKATAREQAVRGTFDPGYFAYTLGKVQILELRAEAKKKLGAKFSLQAFHDALLSHGSPPIPLIRQRVLRDLGAE